MGHHAVGGNHRAIANAHALEDNGSAPDPNIAANNDGGAGVRLQTHSLPSLGAMVGIANADVFTNQAVVPDGDRGIRHQNTPCIDTHMVPQRDAPTVGVQKHFPPKSARCSQLQCNPF